MKIILLEISIWLVLITILAYCVHKLYQFINIIIVVSEMRENKQPTEDVDAYLRDALNKWTPTILRPLLNW